MQKLSPTRLTLRERRRSFNCSVLKALLSFDWKSLSLSRSQKQGKFNQLCGVLFFRLMYTL